MLRENLASKEQELQSLQTNRDARYVEQGNRGGVREEGVAEALGNSEIVESTQENQPSEEDNAHPSTIEECSRAVEDKSESGDQQNELLKPQGDCLRSDETVETVRVIALEPAKQGGLEGEVKDMTEGEMEEKARVSSIEEEWVFVDGKKVLDSYVRELSTAVAEKDSKLAVVLAQVKQLEEQLNGEREEKLRKIQQLEEELKRVKESNALKVDAVHSGVIVVEGAVKGEGEVASEARMQVPLQTKVQESPQSEVQGTTSQSEVQESPQSEVQGTSQPEVQESSQTEVQGASQPEVQKSKEGREASIGIEVQMAAISVGAYSTVVQEPSQTEVREGTVKSSAAEEVAAECCVPQHEEACGERHEGDRKMSGSLDVSGTENAAEKISKLEELVKSLQEQLVEKNRELESKTGYLGIYCILQCSICQQRRCVIAIAYLCMIPCMCVCVVMCVW